jgi:hypothetical protein
MQPTEDSALLRRYVENHSDEAFAGLVTRHGEVWTWGNVLGEHPPSDYFGPHPHEIKHPKIKIIEKPWQVSNIDSQD